MIDLEQALQTVRQQAARLPAMRVDADSAVGLVLAGAVLSDIDVPPFDKAMMDGFAVRSADGALQRHVIGQVSAGAAATVSVTPGTAVRIMTGAALPLGADAVVMKERVIETELEGQVVVTPCDAVRAEQNVQRTASFVARGSTIAKPGHRIRAEDLGALIEVGGHQLSVYPRPTLAVLATGDELVAPNAVPGPHQIRNTNGPLLVGLCRQAGLSVTDLGIAADRQQPLTQRIAAGLQADLLLLSGGVSAGDFDLVPGVLAELGIRRHFHHIAMKPGKPVWFGTAETGTLVFGLPGNPLGTLVGFRLLVTAAVRRMSGLEDEQPMAGRLAEPFQHRGDRCTLIPATLSIDSRGQRVVTPVAWRGSADLGSLIGANCLIRFAAGERNYAADEMVPTYDF